MPSKPSILIVGPNGSGKSASLQHLFEKHAPDIGFIDTEQKGLPFLFDTSKLAYYGEPKDAADFDKHFAAMKAKKPRIVVYDSWTQMLYLTRDRCFKLHTGWDRWNAYNASLREFFKQNKAAEWAWIMTGVDEIVYVEQAEGSRLSRVRCFVQGKELEGKVEGEFLIVLQTIVRPTKEGRPKHVFRTCADGVNSAKAPEFLGLPTECANDVNIVVDKLIEQKQI